jgi:hypothetical protein
MYLARKEFGKVARVFSLDEWTGKPETVWTFLPRLGDEGKRKLSRLCGPGICSTARTPQRALAIIHANEDAAAEMIVERLEVRP